MIKFWYQFFVGQFTLYGGGSGGGGPSSSTTQTSNIPEYARPYVETMLGATQQQLFNTKQTGGTPGTPATYDAEGNQTSPGTPGTPGGTEITGVKPYTAFGDILDASGKIADFHNGSTISSIQLNALV